MNGWIVLAIAAAIIVVLFVVQRIGLIDLREKRRPSGMGGVFGSIDEVFAPTRHEAQQELDRQAILPIPAPVPGDGDRGIALSSRDIRADKYAGSVKIDLSAK